MALHSFRRRFTGLTRDGPYHHAEVEAGVVEVEVAEDTRRCHGEEVAALPLQDAVHLMGSAFELVSDLGGKLGVAGIGDGERSLELLPAYVAQCLASLELERREGGAVRRRSCLGVGRDLLLPGV